MRHPERFNYGALILRLRRYRQPQRKRRWALGIFPPTHSGQNTQIAYCIKDFLTSEQRPSWSDQLAQQPPYPWHDRLLLWICNASLLPSRWPDRTEELIRSRVPSDAAL